MIKLGNIPYIWGGDDPKKGVDCSGLSQILLNTLHLDPPGDQTANELMNNFMNNGAIVHVEDAIMGAQVFYGSEEKATHVATYIGDGLIFGANGGGSDCTTAEIARKKGAFCKIQPINYRADIICIINPDGNALT